VKSTLLDLATGLFLAACVPAAAGCPQRTSVGDNETFCSSDADCDDDDERKHCEIELSLCRACLDSTHCDGDTPRCSQGECVAVDE
jgi:hypothetical protein